MTTPEEVDVTISIVSFNTKDLLRSCVRSIFDGAGNLAIEVIVVDNASIDGSPEMLASEFPDVKVIRNTENRFFTKAHNQALKAASGRYFLVLNSDTRLLRDNLQVMVSFMDQHPDVGVASCLIRNPDLTVYPTCWRYRSLATLFASHFFGQKLFPRALDSHAMAGWNRMDTRPVDVIMDAYALVRRDAMTAIGGYDEDYFLYYTEDDLCLSMAKAGWRVFHVADAEIVHEYKASTKKQPSLFVRRLMIRDAVKYYKKNVGVLAGYVTAAMLWAEFALRYVFVKLGGARYLDRA
jgi:GT2 family glycosyltransferase